MYTINAEKKQTMEQFPFPVRNFGKNNKTTCYNVTHKTHTIINIFL